MKLGISLGDSTHAVISGETGSVTAWSASQDSNSRGLAEVLDRIDSREVDRVMVANPCYSERFPPPIVKVGALRIAGPSSTSIPTMSGWPRSLVRRLAGCVATVSGGHHFDGSPRCSLDTDAVARFALDCRDKGIRAVAIVGTNSQSAPSHEYQAADLITEILGQTAHVVFGNTMQGIGLIERENTAIIEAAMAPFVSRRVDMISAHLNRVGIDTEFHVVAGSGTLISTTDLIAHPLRVHRSDDASVLTGIAHDLAVDSMIIVDSRREVVRVFTMSDGIPHQTNLGENILGVRTVVPGLQETVVKQDATRAVPACVQRMRLWLGDVPAVRINSFDGGHGRTLDIPSVVDVTPRGSASATGAIAARVGGVIDRAFNFGDSTYDEAVWTAKAEAVDAAVRAGADPSRIEVARFTAVPLTYVASRSVRLGATAIGPLL